MGRKALLSPRKASPVSGISLLLLSVPTDRSSHGSLVLLKMGVICPFHSGCCDGGKSPSLTGSKSHQERV